MGNADPINPRSHIDEMIAALAQRQNSVDEAGPSNHQRAGPSAGPSRTPARSVTPSGSNTPAGTGASSAGGSGRNNTSPRGGMYSCILKLFRCCCALNKSKIRSSYKLSDSNVQMSGFM